MFPSLKGQSVKKTHPDLKIPGSTNETTLAVLAQHTTIFTSLRIIAFKHSIKQYRTSSIKLITFISLSMVVKYATFDDYRAKL